MGRVCRNLPTDKLFISPATRRIIYFSGECFKQLPLTNAPRNSNDTGSADLNAANGDRCTGDASVGFASAAVGVVVDRFGALDQFLNMSHTMLS